MQEIMNKVHFLPSSVKDTDEAIAWCAVHLTAPPPPPPTDRPTDRHASSRTGAITRMCQSADSGKRRIRERVRHRAGEPGQLWGLAHSACGGSDGVSACGLLGDIQREGWTEHLDLGHKGRGISICIVCSLPRFLFIILIVVCAFIAPPLRPRGS